MRKEDIDRVVEIENEVFSNPWPCEAFEIELKHNSYVLESNGELLGYLCACKVEDECMVMNVAIAPSQQHKGYGRCILQRLFAEDVMKDVKNYYLEVRSSNARALALYRSLDFISIGLRKNYYKNPVEDAVMMALIRKESATN